MNYPGLKPCVSQVKDLKFLRFAPGGHSSPSLKARRFLAQLLKARRRRSIVTQREKAYQEVRDAIAFGDLKPGERLVEEGICKMFKVGRTPLREALRQLQMEGCVDVLPNKGAMVSRISVQDVEDIYSMIAILEGFAVEVAAKNIQSNDMNLN